MHGHLLLHVFSYWTDNGGCYHYSHGSQFSNYEDLLVAVKKDADEKNLPYKYLQVRKHMYMCKLLTDVTLNVYYVLSLTLGGTSRDLMMDVRTGQPCLPSFPMGLKEFLTRQVGGSWLTIDGGMLMNLKFHCV